ncbi:MAG: GNAT family N-acetyltransferase [Bacilli bacterium]|nr:GNAT family N-acetyltransferase [Bacilli bacterium]
MKAIRIILACLRNADQTYNLINHGDKIIVGVSGGKDSVLLLYALSLYQKFSHTDFTIQPVTLDLGFPNSNFDTIKEFCHSLGLELIVSDAKEVYPILKANQGNSPHLPCSICSRMKKAAINKVANELGFNKVAFAHHADDAVETLFMNEFHGGRIATFSPKMHLEKADIIFIRPFILARESDIIRAVKEENLPVNGSNCPADKHTTREDIKRMLKDIYHHYPMAKENLLSMLSNYEKDDTWGKEIEYQIDNDGLYLKPIVTPYQMSEAINIRYRVFCLEQGIDYSLEVNLEEEKLAKHFLICYKENVIGTIRYLITDDGIKLQRFAIKKEYRGKGYGKEVFKFITEMLAAKYNPVTLFFHAQSYLIPLYESLGYVCEGEPFEEAGRSHILMKKRCE